MSSSKSSKKVTASSPKEPMPVEKGQSRKKIVNSSTSESKSTSSSTSPKQKTAYLTKRILERAARKAFKEAAISSMERMGHVVVEQDGWIIKLYKDGSIERLEQIQRLNIPFKLD